MTTTAEELYASETDSWNWQTEWIAVLSANEWVLAEAPRMDDLDAKLAVLPMRYALQLLIDHFGKEKLIELVREARAVPVWSRDCTGAANPHGCYHQRL